MNSKLTGTPVVIGEVLFDSFPDGSAIMGGAPFNVAWHLQGLGLAPLMLTGVGMDENGDQVRKRMCDWGMDASGVQLKESFPTGRVEVSFAHGQPSYKIVADQAYDHIDAESAINTLDHTICSLLYHGTLVTRTPRSRQMLDRLVRHLGAPVFVDVNLRTPWWTPEEVTRCLQTARWLKLNDEELATITRQTCQDQQVRIEAARNLFDHHQLEMLVVTCGARGAFCVTKQGVFQGAPVNADVVDTVGAGDAFAAVVIAGLTWGWPIQQCLVRALEFAAAICEQRGAIGHDKRFYEPFKSKWGITAE